MKVSKKICNLAIFLFFMLRLMPTFACPGHDEVIRKCNEIAKELIHLIDKGPHADCAEDIKVAATYFDNAGVQVQDLQYTNALKSLKLGKIELQAIANDRPYCVYFAKSIKPFIPEVTLIINKLSSLN